MSRLVSTVKNIARKRPAAPRFLAATLLIAALAVGGYFRASGLFRGLDDGVVFHPDTPKQILALSNYLHGNYVQYFDSPFYDGYPYGLNRMDEALIRPAYGMARAVRARLCPDTSQPPVPPRNSLFRWARSLRVLYGLATLLLIYACARRIGLRRLPATAAAWLYALAPLGSTVTHSASGDVGVDFFLALALWCMAGHAAKGTARWVGAAGAACGMAFACKYQGALGLWIVGLPPLLSMKASRAGLADLAQKGCAAVTGFVTGVFLLTPAYAINPEKTWKDTVANFTFIRDYGVSPLFLEKPLAERIVFGLSRNTPFIIASLGWTVTFVALLALAVATIQGWRSRRPSSPRPESTERADNEGRISRIHALIWSVSAFIPLALLLSTAFKPSVQPFHFSYLLPFMAVAAGWLLDQAACAKPALIRIGLATLMLVVFAEELVVQKREDFFWRRSDTDAAARRFAEGVFVKPQSPSHRYRHDHVLKRFHAEPSLLPVFRNRSAGLHIPGADAWRKRHQLPVPHVPLSEEHSWIFVNGPVFPRSDRMFFVPSDLRIGHESHRIEVRSPETQRTLVFDTFAPRLRLGIRSGRLPSRIHAVVSGKRRTAWLAPHSQTILEWPTVRTVHGSVQEGRPAYHAPVRIRAELGPAWVVVLDQDIEHDIFTAYGPDATQHAARLADVLCADTVRTLLPSLRYIEHSGTPLPVPVERPWPLQDAATPLPGGAYRFEATVINSGLRQMMRLDLTDPSGLIGTTPPHEIPIAPGLNHIEWRFSKAFAPYDAPLTALAEKKGLQLVAWRIAPDPDGLVAWLARPPAPARAFAATVATHAQAVVYPGLGQWRGFSMPPEAKPGERIRYAAHFELDRDIAHKTFHEAVVFLHLKDPNGHRVMALDYPLRKTALDPSRMTWQTAEIPAGLAPGRYRLDAGLYNRRTRKRHAFLDTDAITADRRRRYFQAATIEILPAADVSRPQPF
jgi:hypothetical protein